MPAPVQLCLSQFNKKEKKDTPSHTALKHAHQEPYKEMGGEIVQAQRTFQHPALISFSNLQHCPA